MADRIPCDRLTCCEELVRPPEGSPFSTEDLARLSGWSEWTEGGTRAKVWMCPKCTAAVHAPFVEGD